MEAVITSGGAVSAERIKCGALTVTASKRKKLLKKLPIVRAFAKNATVSLVAGDTLDIEYTDCLKVIGGRVSIEKGYRVALVQYRDTLTVANGAVVDKSKKYDF